MHPGHSFFLRSQSHYSKWTPMSPDNRETFPDSCRSYGFIAPVLQIAKQSGQSSASTNIYVIFSLNLKLSNSFPSRMSAVSKFTRKWNLDHLIKLSHTSADISRILTPQEWLAICGMLRKGCSSLGSAGNITGEHLCLRLKVTWSRPI